MTISIIELDLEWLEEEYPQLELLRNGDFDLHVFSKGGDWDTLVLYTENIYDTIDIESCCDMILENRLVGEGIDSLDQLRIELDKIQAWVEGL